MTEMDKQFEILDSLLQECEMFELPNYKKIQYARLILAKIVRRRSWIRERYDVLTVDELQEAYKEDIE